MKVKKFNCHKCGAPKVNPYEGVYVVCDYCNTIVDIDYASSVAAIEAAPERLERWNEFYAKYLSKSPQYVEEKKNEKNTGNFNTNIVKNISRHSRDHCLRMFQMEKYLSSTARLVQIL